MSWIGGLIGGLGTLWSGSESAEAAGKAADAEAQAAAAEAALAEKMFNWEKFRSQPYTDAGYGALNQLNYLMGIGDPNAVARTRENFDADAFKNYLIEKATEDYLAKNPDATEKQLDKKTAGIINKLDKAGSWTIYEKMAMKGLDLGDSFWKKPFADEGAYGKMGQYGELQRDFTNADFVKDPGYQFRMDEGAKAVDYGAAARGGALSGAAAKQMQRYGQGFASNEFMNAYNRWNQDKANKFNRLSGISGTGQAQVNQLTNAGQNYQNSVNNAGYNAGQARSSGYATQAAINNQMMGNMNTLFQDYWAGRKEA